MPNYTWKGRTRGGKVQEGVLVAESKEAAISNLRKQSILVTGVTEKGKEFALPKLGGGGISQKEIAIFTRQFSVMIDAGLPLVQCLEILGAQQDNRTFQKILFQVRQDVEQGSSLADGLRKHPKAFDALYANMVAAGEAGGILDTILQRLSLYIEKIVKLRAAVRSAMIYPVAVILIAVGVVWVILWKVIPTFATLFEGLGATLPLPTRITIAASKFIGSFWWLVFLSIGLIIFFLNRYHKTYKGKRVLDGLLLKIPVLGNVLKKIAVARFCRTLGTLVSSGVPILDALDITAKTAGNSIVEDAIVSTRNSVEEGKTISEPLKNSAVFPGMVVQMVAVGEQTGALETMLNKIADFYEDEVDEATANLLALLEPIMILFLGIVIGGIVISMYMPMFTLISKIG
ncbi:MAG: type II secretion system F family protein [Acidobacteria bacterium]|uniref:Type II secretion system F family protein n=1 Tax=Candidatus Polarisedimenticola svalbardensis TaxID=2886004 RepID=A0A8J6Y5C2_9BACT|nr:type II secretion system F family protein [Candidatus Polarisedimenticola svalbardensis]